MVLAFALCAFHESLRSRSHVLKALTASLADFAYVDSVSMRWFAICSPNPLEVTSMDNATL